MQEQGLKVKKSKNFENLENLKILKVQVPKAPKVWVGGESIKLCQEA